MDFYLLLNENINEIDNVIDNDKNNLETCLISQNILDDNHVTLQCNHKFNLIPLYYEVIKQKTVTNYFETTNLKINEIKCPYCRKITNKLLPYHSSSEMNYIRGVNYPFKYCMKIHFCQWVIKTGKNKGSFCNCSAFSSNDGIFCSKHLTKLDKNKKSKTPDNNIDININKKYTIPKLKEILKTLGLKVSGNKYELIERLKIVNYQFN